MSNAHRRTFRLFISSTFSDFIAEREALHERVFPRLDEYCQQRGARFQAIDLRWGVNESAMRSHDTLRICIEEIERSRRASPRPNFVALLGNRYGWRPLPSVIPLPIWRRLKKGVRISQWKRVVRAYCSAPEMNLNPPAMVLRTCRADQAEAIHADAREVLGIASQMLDEGDRFPLLASATHQEIKAGLLDPPDAAEHVHVYIRRIKGLPFDRDAREFIDWDDQRNTPCIHSREQLAVLGAQLLQRFPSRVHQIETLWTGKTIGDLHIDSFCNSFFAHQRELIDREVDSALPEADHDRRSRLHRSFAEARARGFYGRETDLRAIGRYASSRGRSAPLVLSGPGGSGKSALLAAASARAAGSKGHTVFARFIGAASDCDARAFVRELWSDIAIAFGLDQRAGECSDFGEFLRCIPRKRRLLLFVDGVDQLEVGHDWSPTDWIPSVLAPNVRIIVSVRDGSIANELRRRVKGHKRSLAAYPMNDARALLQAWLRDSAVPVDQWGICQRKLQPVQTNAVLRAFREEGRPLWLRIIAEEARGWKSQRLLPLMPTSIGGVIARLRRSVLKSARHHGSCFVDRSLAYISASRSGISEIEICSALAGDPKVIAEFRSEERTKRRWQSNVALPPVLWSRLRSDLEPFLMETLVDGVRVLRFFHREFDVFVQQSILRKRSERRSVHAHLAKTFVALAPAREALIGACDVNRVQRSSALRRLMEEPWHRERAGDDVGLRDLLREPIFCLAKYAANRSADHVDFIRRLRLPIDRWLALQDRWSTITDKGDQRWPAHRILLQLAFEAAEGTVPVLSELQHLVAEAIVPAPPLLRASPARYADHFHRRVVIPQGLKDEYWCRAERYIEVMRDHGQGFVIDITTGETWRLGERRTRGHRRRKLSVMGMGDGGPRAGSIGIGRSANAQGSGIWLNRGAALILGASAVHSLGRVGDVDIFRCDGALYFIELARVSYGMTETYLGEVCDAYHVDGQAAPTYQRFDTNIVESPTTFMSIGWSGNNGQREDFIMEVFDIVESRVVCRARVEPESYVDLPIQYIARLNDGSLIFEGDDYRRFIAKPPIVGAVVAERFKGGFLMTTLPDGTSRPRVFREDQDPYPEGDVLWLVEGPVGKWGGGTIIEAPDDQARLCEFFEDGISREWLELLDDSGALQRWVADVPIEVCIELGNSLHQFLVIKQSGPVVVQRTNVK